MDVVDEQEKAGEEADKDIGDLSHFLCTDVTRLTMLDMLGPRSQETTDQQGIDKCKLVQIMMCGPQGCKVVDESEILEFLMHRTTRETREEYRGRLINTGTVGTVVNSIVEGLTQFEHRDGLSTVGKRCVQNVSNIEKQRRHLRTIESFEETEATTDSGAASCVFPRDFAQRRSNQTVSRKQARDVQDSQWAESCSCRSIECSTEYGFTRRQTGAVTSVQKIIFVVSRLAEPGHHVQFTRTGRCIVNKRNGSKIPLHLKNRVSTLKLWVKGERHDKNTNPKI